MTENAKTPTNEAPGTQAKDDPRKRYQEERATVSALADAMLDVIPEGTSHQTVISAVMTAVCRMCVSVEIPIPFFLETMQSLVKEGKAIEEMTRTAFVTGSGAGVPSVAVDRLREGLDPAMMKTLLHLAMRMKRAQQTRTHSIAMIMLKGTPGTARIVSFEEVAGGAIGEVLSPENLARVKDDPSMKEDEVRVIAITDIGAGLCHLAIEKMAKHSGVA